MIKTQELKVQIEELTKQNDMMLVELEQMKRLISGGGGQQQDGQQDGQQQGGQQQAGGQAQNQQQQQGQQQQQQDQNQQQQGQQQNSGSQSKKDRQQSSGQAANLANDLLQIKDLVAKLEEKTSQYVSSQTSGSLTDKDVVNLVLTLINGMVDWSSEFVSSHASGQGQQK